MPQRKKFSVAIATASALFCRTIQGSVLNLADFKLPEGINATAKVNALPQIKDGVNSLINEGTEQFAQAKAAASSQFIRAKEQLPEWKADIANIATEGAEQLGQLKQNIPDYKGEFGHLANEGLQQLTALKADLPNVKGQIVHGTLEAKQKLADMKATGAQLTADGAAGFATAGKAVQAAALQAKEEFAHLAAGGAQKFVALKEQIPDYKIQFAEQLAQATEAANAAKGQFAHLAADGAQKFVALKEQIPDYKIQFAEQLAQATEAANAAKGQFAHLAADGAQKFVALKEQIPDYKIQFAEQLAQATEAANAAKGQFAHLAADGAQKFVALKEQIPDYKIKFAEQLAQVTEGAEHAKMELTNFAAESAAQLKNLNLDLPNNFDWRAALPKDVDWRVWLPADFDWTSYIPADFDWKAYLPLKFPEFEGLAVDWAGLLNAFDWETMNAELKGIDLDKIQLQFPEIKDISRGIFSEHVDWATTLKSYFDYRLDLDKTFDWRAYLIPSVDFAAFIKPQYDIEELFPSDFDWKSILPKSDWRAFIPDDFDWATFIKVNPHAGLAFDMRWDELFSNDTMKLDWKPLMAVFAAWQPLTIDIDGILPTGKEWFETWAAVPWGDLKTIAIPQQFAWTNYYDELARQFAAVKLDWEAVPQAAKQYLAEIKGLNAWKEYATQSEQLGTQLNGTFADAKEGMQQHKEQIAAAFKELKLSPETYAGTFKEYNVAAMKGLAEAWRLH